jgi:hypothetical protein
MRYELIAKINDKRKPHMRYELVEKINGKKKPGAGKGMGRILADHSRICRMPFDDTTNIHPSQRLISCIGPRG